MQSPSAMVITQWQKIGTFQTISEILRYCLKCGFGFHNFAPELKTTSSAIAERPRCRVG